MVSKTLDFKKRLNKLINKSKIIPECDQKFLLKHVDNLKRYSDLEDLAEDIKRKGFNEVLEFLRKRDLAIKNP